TAPLSARRRTCAPAASDPWHRCPACLERGRARRAPAMPSPIWRAPARPGTLPPASTLAEARTTRQVSRFSGPRDGRSIPAMCVRDDWTDFRTLETLTRKAGVPRAKLACLVLKELVDNALDEGAQVRFDVLEDGYGFRVEDDGPGLPGTDQEVA